MAYDGILGVDFLKKARFTLNLEKQTLTIMREEVKMIPLNEPYGSDHRGRSLGLITPGGCSTENNHSRLGQSRGPQNTPEGLLAQSEVTSQNDNSPSIESMAWQVYNHASLRLPAEAK